MIQCQWLTRVNAGPDYGDIVDVQGMRGTLVAYDADTNLATVAMRDGSYLTTSYTELKHSYGFPIR